MTSRLQVVVGGQFGSEAKGACTARLTEQALRRGDQVTVVRVAGPNAGHTAYDKEGRKWALRQIPVAAVVDPTIQLVIGAGSEIDPFVLGSEIYELENAGIPIRDRLIVDGQATIITDAHRERETGLVQRVGSTGKGVGAARADRLMRKAQIARQYEWRTPVTIVHDTWEHLQQRLLRDTVIIEGTQGYGLGLHAGFYPKCTSSDARAIDFLAMAGIDPCWAAIYEPWVVLRTYPIRVAGDSGPLRGETTWEALGFEPEMTTVTKKVRRVGRWDGELAGWAIQANGGSNAVRISLSMADYVVPGAKGIDGGRHDAVAKMDPEAYGDLLDLVGQVEADAGAPVGLVGTGPQTFIEWDLV